MVAALERLDVMLRAIALFALLAALAVCGSDAVAVPAPAGDCDNTCQAGKKNDPNPCITSGTGKCVPSATAPQGTLCDGCGFSAVTDKNGNVIGCKTSCSSITP